MTGAQLSSDLRGGQGSACEDGIHEARPSRRNEALRPEPSGTSLTVRVPVHAWPPTQWAAGRAAEEEGAAHAVDPRETAAFVQLVVERRAREPWHPGEQLEIRIRRSSRMQAGKIASRLHHVACRGIVSQMLPRQPVGNSTGGSQLRHGSVGNCSTLSARTVTHSFCAPTAGGSQPTRDRWPVASEPLR